MRVIATLLLLTATTLLGNTKTTHQHPLKTVYTTLIRYIAVDRGDKILEKDIEGAYIIFQTADSGKMIQGKIEIIERGEKRCEMKLHFKGAHYREILFMKKFTQKLKEENL